LQISVVFIHKDNDGGNDLLILADNLTLHIFFNTISIDQKELCKTNPPLTLAYSGLSDIYDNTYNANHFYFSLQVGSIAGNRYYDYNIPGTGVIRTADFDLDGWVDISIQYKDATTNLPKTAFFQNVGCPSDLTNNITNSNKFDGNLNFANCRYFNSMGDSVGIVTSPAGNSPVLSVSFFDYAELG